MRSNLVAVAVCLVFSGVAARGVAADGTVPFRVLFKSTSALLCPHAAGLEWARTREEFDRIVRETCESPPDVDLDFGRDMVIFYFMGHQSVIGRSAEVVSVRRGGGAMTVNVVDHVGPGGIQEDYDPFIIVSVHKWPGTIQLNRTVVFNAK